MTKESFKAWPLSTFWTSSSTTLLSSHYTLCMLEPSFHSSTMPGLRLSVAFDWEGCSLHLCLAMLCWQIILHGFLTVLHVCDYLFNNNYKVSPSRAKNRFIYYASTTLKIMSFPWGKIWAGLLAAHYKTLKCSIHFVLLQEDSGVKEDWPKHAIYAASGMRIKVFCLWPKNFMSSTSIHKTMSN